MCAQKSQFNLFFHPRNLRRLEEVDFSGNNLWSLPSGVFCNSPDLRRANLSGNHLLQVADAGLAEVQESGIPCQVRDLHSMG